MEKENKTFYTGIDTWRGIAALMVCVYHFSLYQNNFGMLFPPGHWIQEVGKHGYLGVYVFFVISGFVIPLAMHKGAYQYSKFLRFISKRSLRIEPPYLATIFLTLAMSYCFAKLWGLDFAIDIKQLFANAFYLVPFIEGTEWYNIIFWTLAIEFQFYLLCALIFPLWVYGSRWIRHLSFIAFLLSAIWVTDNRFVLFYSALFGFGTALFLFRSGFINRFELLLYALLCGGLLYTGNTHEIMLTACIAFLLLCLPDFNFGLGTRLGKISYSLYLTHGLSGSIFLMFTYKGIYEFSELLFIGALLISVVFALVFNLIVEKPSQKVSQKIKL